MKILKPGSEPKIIFAACSNCKCEFEFTQLDVLPPSWMNGDKLKCPTCGTVKMVFDFTEHGKTVMQFKKIHEKIQLAHESNLQISNSGSGKVHDPTS